MQNEPFIPKACYTAAAVTVCRCDQFVHGLLFFSLKPAFHPSLSPPLLLHCHPDLQDGIVLGADTRSTSGSTVADKNCEKIHYIAPNIYCCGAGTAADTEAVTGAEGLA